MSFISWSVGTIDKTVPGDKGEINALIKGIEIVKYFFTKQDLV